MGFVEAEPASDQWATGTTRSSVEPVGIHPDSALGRTGVRVVFATILLSPRRGLVSLPLSGAVSRRGLSRDGPAQAGVHVAVATFDGFPSGVVCERSGVVVGGVVDSGGVRGVGRVFDGSRDGSEGGVVGTVGNWLGAGVSVGSVVDDGPGATLGAVVLGVSLGSVGDTPGKVNGVDSGSAPGSTAEGSGNSAEGLLGFPSDGDFKSLDFRFGAGPWLPGAGVGVNTGGPVISS